MRVFSDIIENYGWAIERTAITGDTSGKTPIKGNLI